MSATLKDQEAAMGSAVQGNDSAGEPGVNSPIAAESQSAEAGVRGGQVVQGILCTAYFQGKFISHRQH